MNAKTNSPEKITEVDLSKAEELAQQARQLRIQQCSDEIEKVLAKYKCTFRPFFIVDGTNVKSYVNIVPATDGMAPLRRFQPDIPE